MENVNTLLMTSQDFLKWPEYSSQSGFPKIRNIRIAQLRYNSNSLFWKTDISATEFNEVKLYSDSISYSFPTDFFVSRGINSQKLDDIINSLCP